MGQACSKVVNTTHLTSVDHGSLIPQGIYTTDNDYDISIVRHLIRKGQLAPFYTGKAPLHCSAPKLTMRRLERTLLQPQKAVLWDRMSNLLLGEYRGHILSVDILTQCVCVCTPYSTIHPEWTERDAVTNPFVLNAFYSSEDLRRLRLYLLFVPFVYNQTWVSCTFHQSGASTMQPSKRDGWICWATQRKRTHEESGGWIETIRMSCSSVGGLQQLKDDGMPAQLVTRHRHDPTQMGGNAGGEKILCCWHHPQKTRSIEQWREKLKISETAIILIIQSGEILVAGKHAHNLRHFCQCRFGGHTRHGGDSAVLGHSKRCASYWQWSVQQRHH